MKKERLHWKGPFICIYKYRVIINSYIILYETVVEICSIYLNLMMILHNLMRPYADIIFWILLKKRSSSRHYMKSIYIEFSLILNGIYKLYESFRRKPGWRFTACIEYLILETHTHTHACILALNLYKYTYNNMFTYKHIDRQTNINTYS